MALYKDVNGKRVKITVQEEEAIKAAWALEKAEADDRAYKKKRLESYPAIGDQLDMLWHDMKEGNIPVSPTFYAAIEAVKQEYPKPE